MASASTIAHQEITYQIIGCAMKVHNELGTGLRELHYHRALSKAMEEEGLNFAPQWPFRIEMGDKKIGILYIDHLVEDAVIVEEKALSRLLTADEVGQVVTYLAATEKSVGLLLNFGRPSLEYKRILPPKKLDAWRRRIGRYSRVGRSR
jgi:GxxExxY protein